mmetsp:Transcript_51475/g.143920  ORF Transcript_51475/g.143920 Transcript_51475/m.143920 type:complete len:360 (+) Transcript_51475:251-1330(+)
MDRLGRELDLLDSSHYIRHFVLGRLHQRTQPPHVGEVHVAATRARARRVHEGRPFHALVDAIAVGRGLVRTSRGRQVGAASVARRGLLLHRARNGRQFIACKGQADALERVRGEARVLHPFHQVEVGRVTHALCPLRIVDGHPELFRAVSRVREEVVQHAEEVRRAPVDLARTVPVEHLVAHRGRAVLAIVVPVPLSVTRRCLWRQRHERAIVVRLSDAKAAAVSHRSHRGAEVPRQKLQVAQRFAKFVGADGLLEHFDAARLQHQLPLGLPLRPVRRGANNLHARAGAQQLRRGLGAVELATRVAEMEVHETHVDLQARRQPYALLTRRRRDHLAVAWADRRQYRGHGLETHGRVVHD